MLTGWQPDTDAPMRIPTPVVPLASRSAPPPVPYPSCFLPPAPGYVPPPPDAETGGPALPAWNTAWTDLCLRPASSTRRRHKRKQLEDKNYVNRPPNCFILFRKNFVQQHAGKGDSSADKSKLSARASDAWSKLPNNERAKWKELAKVIAAAHQQAHPGYQYKPRRKLSSATAAKEPSSEPPSLDSDSSSFPPEVASPEEAVYNIASQPSFPPYATTSAASASVASSMSHSSLALALDMSHVTIRRPSSSDELKMPSPTRAGAGAFDFHRARSVHEVRDHGFGMPPPMLEWSNEDAAGLATPSSMASTEPPASPYTEPLNESVSKLSFRE
jgi:hypothetical protein